MGEATESEPDVSIIVISYETRALTLECLRTLHQNTRATRFETIVWDNASTDGSADAIAAAFPDVRLVRSTQNLGFAEANNRAATLARGAWLLLLNPDTEIHDGAVDRLVAFAAAHPEHGIYGGRTVFPDGSLNIASCWNRMTPWSLFCSAVGLVALFPKSEFFNPEALGGWRRDSVREVDIVVGCFMLLPKALWEALDGFDRLFWMYGEEADLCLRARRLGYSPIITPDATIMHLVGAASAKRADKLVLVAQARATLIRRHWSPAAQPLGRALLWLWAALRIGAVRTFALLSRRDRSNSPWERVWAERRIWLAGYVERRERSTE